jgi:hypothetical protein
MVDELERIWEEIREFSWRDLGKVRTLMSEQVVSVSRLELSRSRIHMQSFAAALTLTCPVLCGRYQRMYMD